MSAQTTPGALALIRLEAQRARLKLHRALSGTDRSARTRAAVGLAAYGAGICAALYAWVTVLFGAGLPGQPHPAAAAGASVMAWALAFDSARRATGAFTPERARDLDRWLELAGPAPQALAVRATVRAALLAAPYAWMVLLPVGPWVQALSPASALAAAAGPFAFVFAGHAVGRTWAAASTWARTALGVVGACALASAVASVLALDPALAPWLGTYPTGAMSTTWDALLAPGVGLGLAMVAAASACAAERWALDRTGWDRARDRASAPRALRPTRATATRSVHLARDVSRALAWARRDWLVAGWTATPPLAAYAFIAAGPWLDTPTPIREVLLRATTGSWLPWSFLFTSALLALAFADGVWAGEPRAFWAWRRTELPDPRTFLRARWAAVTTGIGAWLGLLGVLLALGGAPARDVAAHFTLAASASGAAAAAGLLAVVCAVRMRIETGTGGRYLRYAATLGGFAFPAITLAWAGSAAAAAVAGTVVCVGALRAAERVYLKTEFTTAD